MEAQPSVVVSDEDQAALRTACDVEGTALCTIVGIEGSFSRRLGAQLAVTPSGYIAGSLSDGCLERELAKQTKLLRRSGPKLVRYGKGSPYIDFRLPCGSGLDLLIDPAPDRKQLRAAVDALDARLEVWLDLPGVPSGLLQKRCYIPALELVILGAGPEAEYLERFARSYGIACKLIVPGLKLSLGQPPATVSADKWTALVTLFHDHEWERALLTWALATPAFYIGAIGGHAAREQRKEFLVQCGYSDKAMSRIRSPIGLIRQARDARVLALSVLAELIEVYECSRAQIC